MFIHRPFEQAPTREEIFSGQSKQLDKLHRLQAAAIDGELRRIEISSQSTNRHK
jgi:hypothetical protein